MSDGTVVHVRLAAKPRRRCTFCDGLTPQQRLRECDFKLPDGSTCDRLMCSECATRVGPDQDLCPQHREAPPRTEESWAEVDDLFDRTDWPPERLP
jgi:hypothetical protein